MNINSGNFSLKPLSVHSDSRGHLFEILRSDDKFFFEGFGQVYANCTKPTQVKGIHRHFTHADIVCCLLGKLLVLTVSNDGRIEEIELSGNNPSLLRIPPSVWHGWQCISQEDAVTVSVVRKPFDPLHPDVELVDAFENPWGYQWRE